MWAVDEELTINELGPNLDAIPLVEKLKWVSTHVNYSPFSAWVRKWCRRNPPSERASERRTNWPYIKIITKLPNL